MKVLACLSVLFVSAPAALAETVLLDFTATWCPPCRQMVPVVSGLEREGYRVQRLDIDVPENRAKAAEYQVKEIPTFIVLKEGREVGRLVGAVPAEKLQRLLGPGTERRATPKKKPEPVVKPDDRPITTLARAEKPSGQELIRYSVRIVVDDTKSRSFGTGTVIRSVAGETLVLSCAHLFQGISRQAKTTVEFFGVSERPKLTAEVVARDTAADLSLIRVATNQTFPAALVAPAEFAPKKDLAALSVGCDNGSDPTLRRMQITAVNRYLGPSTIECTGEPVEGRSGGGLFNESGEIIGVCSARDPADHRGIYGGTAAIHTLLEQNHLASLYRRQPGQDSNIRVASLEQENKVNRLTLPADRELGLDVGRNLPLPAGAENAEVVCVIRSPQDPKGPAKVIVLERASPEFLSALEREQAKQSALTRTSMISPSHSTGSAERLDKAPADPAGWRGTTKPVKPILPEVTNPNRSGPIEESAKWRKDWPAGANSAEGTVRR